MTAALLTTRQLAALLGVHVNTVYKLPIPYYRFFRQKRYSMDDVDAYLLRSRNEATDGNRVGVSGTGPLGGAAVDRAPEPAPLRAKDQGHKTLRRRRTRRVEDRAAWSDQTDAWRLPRTVGG